MDPINPCCCCLLNSPHKSLKTPHIYFGTTEVFLDLLEDCFQIQLTLDNEDGSGICEECEGRLRDASDFKRQVQRCQAKLNAKRARRDTVLLIKDEIPSETADENETCDEPVSNEEPDDALAEEPDDVVKPEEGLISLSWSGAAGVVAQSPRPTRAVKKQPATPCSVRLERIGNDTHQCPECPIIFDHPSYLSMHMNQVHPVTLDTSAKGVYICDHCGRRFTRKLFLISHMRAHIITKAMYTPNLNEFMIIRRGKKPYGCKLCNKQFKIKYSLSRHTVVHTKLKMFSCEICNKSFKYKHDLTRHVKAHTVQKPYRCELCPKSFSQKTGLNSHMTIHTGLRPYMCPICQKTFRHRHVLTNHVRIHTGVKPYTCEVCNKSFTERGQLRMHTRVHTGQRPYVCEICDRRFSQKVHVAMHRSRVHT